MNLKAFTRSRSYDLLMAVPLIVWFGLGVLQLRPLLAADARALLTGRADLVTALQFFAVAASAGFDLLLIYLLTVRVRPIRKSKGLTPRLCGVFGTFLSVAILRLPAARLSLPWQALADILILGGGTGSIVVLAKLGRAFAILPEARLLVTGGVYARVRHPLYAAETLTILGTAIQFAQPWAGLLALFTLALQVARSLFEERVLTEAYPEYAAYRARTWRFIPGVI